MDKTAVPSSHAKVHSCGTVFSGAVVPKYNLMGSLPSGCAQAKGLFARHEEKAESKEGYLYVLVIQLRK